MRILPGYGIALIGVAAASVVTFVVVKTIGPNPVIGYAYLFAIMSAAWWGGYGPGMVACALTFFLAPYLLIPNFTATRIDLNRLALTALVSLLVSWVSVTRRRTEQMLRTANEELAHHVAERTAELEHANMALAKRTAELERSNAELEQYAYVASHDLQEPIRTLILYSQLLTRRYGATLDSGGREMLGVMESSSQRMQTLVNDLLSYSRTIAGTDNAPQPVPIAEVVAEAVANCGAMITETNAEVVYGTLPTVSAKRDQLVQVFQNLLSNAIKYRSPDAPPRVVVNASRDLGAWAFVVQDNGMGIDMQYADHIFKVFTRLHGRDIPGTGIGLAICKKIIEEHGGRIWVESISGEGAAFKFTLPIIERSVGVDVAGPYPRHSTTFRSK